MDTEEIKYFTVSQYNQAIKNFLDSKVECQVVHIKGEVSNYKGHTRGHLYFTLKDEESRINAVMFKTSASKLDFVPKDGDAKTGVKDPGGLVPLPQIPQRTIRRIMGNYC